MGSFLAVMALAALFGGMLFFGAVMTPLVFSKLPPDVAGPFIRAAFPRYYLFITVTSALAAIGLLIRGNPWYALLAVIVTGITLWLWLEWMPHLNAVRDAGNQVDFQRGHRLSVWVNAVQFVIVFALLAGLAG
ncbi:MAG: DUF4149 domain-containing protein [Rhodospirillales bacterium]|jgi:hypothetical protein|uniref:DUF4149 domain-containing protein n=1 Tax=Acidiphilium multivorum TaxID=62140 RepID=UPI001F4C5177|nr:DUF4149 domain-containing protein [Acidiphilium multivorum]MBU6357619.1 DUF4149 domain-containing protein [Rhodospirillales bacterium]UNC15502.1 DUF4149 domain-containing protein [Acidiphilium multivorum]